MENTTVEKRPKKHRVFRVLLRILVILIAFLASLILVLNIPLVQTYVAQKIIGSIRAKTGSEISLGSVRISLPNAVSLTDIYVQDQHADTLVYMHSMNVRIGLLKLLSNEIDVTNLDIENLVTNINRKEPTANFNYQFIIDVFSSPDADTSIQTSAWKINVKEISLKNIRAVYADARAETNLSISLSEFNTTIKSFDLINRQLFIDSLVLKSSSAKIVSSKNGQVNSSDSGQDSLVKEPRDSIRFIANLFPDWSFSVSHFLIDDIDFQYDDTSYPKLAEVFDSRHIHLEKLSSAIKNFTMSTAGLNAEVDSLCFNESCGFKLEALSGEAQLNENLAQLKDLEIKSSRSKISGNATLAYSSFNDLFVNPGNCKVKMNLESSTINTRDVFLFQPTLASDTVMGKFKNTVITITARANGKINDLNVERLDVACLEKTILKTNCNLKGLPDFSKLRFNIRFDTFSTILPDVYRFVDPKLLAGFNLPQTLELNGTANGKTDSLLTKFHLNSSYGVISANAFYRKQKSGRDTINMNFSARNVRAGTILGDTLYGNANFSGEAGVLIIDSGLYYGSVKLMIDSVGYNSYVYKDISISSQLNGDLYSATVSSSDTNITFGLSTEINLHEPKKLYSVDLDLARINLKALNFTERNITASTNLKAELSYGGPENSEADLLLTNTKIYNDEKLNPVDSFEVKAISTPQGIDVAVNSAILDGKINSNITSDNFVKTFQTAFQKYWGERVSAELPPGKNLTFLINAHIPKDIMLIVSPKLNELEIEKFEGSYSSDNNDLSLLLNMPRVNYSGVIFDTLNLVVSGIQDRLSIVLNCDKISYSDLQLDSLKIVEKTDNGKIISEISVGDASSADYYFLANELQVGSDFYKFKFLQDGLVLDGAKWEVGAGNYFMVQKKSVNTQSVFVIQDFIFVNDTKSFGIVTEGESQIIRFKNFAVQNILHIAEFHNKSQPNRNESNFIKGNLNGDIVFPSFPGTKDINVNLSINDLYILDSLAGDLSLRIKTLDNKWDVDAGLTSRESILKLSGIVDQNSVVPVLNLHASVDINDLNRFEYFSFGTVSDLHGKMTGKFDMSGTTQNPVIDGELGFDETSLKVNSLNFFAKLHNEKIRISNSGFHFENFVIEDLQAEKFTIDGDVLTRDWSNPEFDLKLSTKKFQPVNSTSADNPVFFGKLSLGADVKLKGFLKSPEIQANIHVDSITNLTYALPGSELKLVSSEGIVEFQDSIQASDSALATAKGDYLTDSLMKRMKGFDLKARVEIEPGVNFTIDIDPKSGDYLTLNGNAKLDISSNGRDYQNIVGVYEINTGSYQLSFYDLVKKDFIIEPGSTIAWSGKPMDGDMNITATYIIRTSSIGLVANESATMSEEEKKIFNKRLPYEVKLNIHGLLSKPEISFNITLPTKYLNDNPLVEAKLRQLNTVENTQQLNKQVFALLVAGSFMAENPVESTGSSSNLASTAARNSVNGILASQMNNMSGKYISGVDVNFGLTSYEDYGSGSSDVRTEMDVQVSKKLFNDRVTVEAENSFGLNGSKKETTNSTTAQGYGQFAVIYSLTESGEYKLRAYYQNAYDPFDGDISYSGIALIYEKELDQLRLSLKRAKKKPDQKIE